MYTANTYLERVGWGLVRLPIDAERLCCSFLQVNPSKSQPNVDKHTPQPKEDSQKRKERRGADTKRRRKDEFDRRIDFESPTNQHISSKMTRKQCRCLITFFVEYCVKHVGLHAGISDNSSSSYF